MHSVQLAVQGRPPSEYSAALWGKLLQEWERVLEPSFSGIIEVSFVSRDAMQQAYLASYGKAEATDVLSWRLEPQPGNPDPLVGEILICTPVARQMALRLQTDVATELATLFVHGLIHLAGFDHAEPGERHRFEQLTHDIMSSHGLKAISLWSA